MTNAKNSDAKPRPRPSCSVAIVYEDEATRARAMALCDRLVSQFWSEIEFQFQWFEFGQLADQASAHAAVNAAAVADVMVLATRVETQVPTHVELWLEHWVRQRPNREGVMIALVGLADEPLAKKIAKQHWLRGLARRARVDFLSDAVPIGLWVTPESVQWLNQRAGRLTPILNEILERPHRPPGLDGL